MIIIYLGCDSKIDYIELKMPKKNPTSYEFNASLYAVKESIIKNHKKMPLHDHIESGRDSSIIWGIEILTKLENKEDFYINNLLPFDTSLIYIGIKESIPYFYSIHIHLTAINPNKTLVEINTINPEISIGVRFPYNIIPAEPGAALTKPVPPSTIEEYMVLQVIGEGLGIKDKMPALILPEPLSFK